MDEYGKGHTLLPVRVIHTALERGFDHDLVDWIDDRSHSLAIVIRSLATSVVLEACRIPSGHRYQCFITRFRLLPSPFHTCRQLLPHSNPNLIHGDLTS